MVLLLFSGVHGVISGLPVELLDLMLPETLSVRNDRGRSPAPGVWGGRMRRVNRTDTILTTTRQTRTGIRSRVIPRIDRQSLGDSIVSSTTIPFVRSRNIAFKAARMKPRTAFFTFFSGVNMGLYVMPKLIELIKDPAVDSRTNSTPFVIGETVTGLRSGVRLRVVAPNDVSSSIHIPMKNYLLLCFNYCVLEY